MVIPKTAPESELIGLAQTGDVRAFQRLAELHTESLYRSVLVMSRDRHKAEDIVQETLVEAWRSLGRFDERCRFSTWLYGILRHRFLKTCRQRSGEQPTFLDVTLFESLPQKSLGPEALFQMSEDAERVHRAVAELPEKHREVIELRFFADASLEDIAAVLEVPLGTVKSRLHHGLKKLREVNLAVNLFPSVGES
jgi:RNA polymerase sigma-70 factor, ECF subfamily